VAAKPALPPETALPAQPGPPPQYVVADPAKATPASMLPLGDAGTGFVVEGLRIVSSAGQTRAGNDSPDSPIQSAWRVPARLGGGFLFRAGGALYASETFDGLLRPIVLLPAEVSNISFGPKSVIARVDGGERWILDPKTGRRVGADPPGLLDVAALDDGRAAALVEGGVVLVSTDKGEKWTDVSKTLRAPASRVFVDSGDVPTAGSAGSKDAGPTPAAAKEPPEIALWIETQGGPAFRVMPGGRLAEYDAAPQPKPLEGLRPKDPAWHEDDAPIRHALRLGAPLDTDTALVVAHGDLVKVNIVTGVIDVVAAGKLPPDATCAGTRTADDIVFTCSRQGGASFAVSHTVDASSGARSGDKSPVVEQTFAESGRFLVSDDGGIAFEGPCDKPRAGGAARRVVCVRAASGGWQQYDLDDGDAGSPALDIVRWLPRADGDAIGVAVNVGGNPQTWGIVDARTGEVHAWAVTPTNGQLRNSLQSAPPNYGGNRYGNLDPGYLADRTWTVTPQGTLRGWVNLGSGTGEVEIGVDGTMQTSAFVFERISYAGGVALARTRDGRVWQTLDRGATWAEVASPPASRPNQWIDTHACSVVGCDLGQWYRIGWAPTPPTPQPPPVAAPAAPHVEKTPPPTLACKPLGDMKKSAASRGEHSPDDLGLGASKVAATSGRPGSWEYLRVPFPRRIIDAVRGDQGSDDAAPRALVHGFSTQPGDTRLLVTGPNRDIFSLVRDVWFVPAFDPLSPVKRSPLAMRDIWAHRKGAPEEDLIPSGVVPLTPVDPAAPDDLLVQATGGTVAVAKAAGGAPRVFLDPGVADEWRIVSAVAIDAQPDPVYAWLEQDASGASRVGKSNAPSAAFLDAPPNAQLYPANIDALAVGPHGELAIVRTPSGREPPSALDPALVLVSGAAPTALAPWSTLVPADDPACKADPSGWRATLQTVAAWVRLTGAGGAAEPAAMDGQPMLARVRWNATRVCLEGIEVRQQDVWNGSSTPMAMPTAPSPWGSAWDSPVETWVVARFAGGTVAGRAGILQGAETRESLECKLAGP
jgi:hypothetical protein